MAYVYCSLGVGEDKESKQSHAQGPIQNGIYPGHPHGWWWWRGQACSQPSGPHSPKLPGASLGASEISGQRDLLLPVPRLLREESGEQSSGDGVVGRIVRGQEETRVKRGQGGGRENVLGSST